MLNSIRILRFFSSLTHLWMSPTKTRSTSDMLYFLYEKCKILCHSVFKPLVISTFPAGEKPHQIKSNSIINALFVKKILKGVSYQSKHEIVSSWGLIYINANGLLCYSWMVISRYLSDMISLSTWYSLSGKYWHRIDGEYPTQLVRTESRQAAPGWKEHSYLTLTLQ